MSAAVLDRRFTVGDMARVMDLILENLASADGDDGSSVCYVRRKPGKGLVMGLRCQRLAPLYLIAGEPLLSGGRIRLDIEELARAELDGSWPGLVRVRNIDLTLQAFPADQQLPALESALDPTGDADLREKLEDVARELLGDPGIEVDGIIATPVHYKPGSRCVIRYDLSVSEARNGHHQTLSVFGKLYDAADKARTVQGVMEHLYARQLEDAQTRAFVPYLSFLPRPLGVVDSLGLVLNAAGGGGLQGGGRSGLRALRPANTRSENGRLVLRPPSASDLRRAAGALAWLHTSPPAAGVVPRRSASDEASSVEKRADLLAQYSPGQATAVREVAALLAKRLRSLDSVTYRPAHGGFKPSQLLFDEGRAMVFDLDGYCMADPALDVGYFLAYLRPPSFWRRRPGSRLWFEIAAGHFERAYRAAVVARGVDSGDALDTVQRSRLHQAAVLLKISTRRPNRLNSRRPNELAAVISEIHQLIRKPAGDAPPPALTMSTPLADQEVADAI